MGILGFIGIFMYVVYLFDSKVIGKFYFDLVQSYFLKRIINYLLFYFDIKFCVRFQIEILSNGFVDLFVWLYFVGKILYIRLYWVRGRIQFFVFRVYGYCLDLQ